MSCYRYPPLCKRGRECICTSPVLGMWRECHYCKQRFYLSQPYPYNWDCPKCSNCTSKYVSLVFGKPAGTTLYPIE